MTAPPPPPGVNEAVGFEVVMHNACLLHTIVGNEFAFFDTAEGDYKLQERATLGVLPYES